MQQAFYPHRPFGEMEKRKQCNAKWLIPLLKTYKNL